MKRYLIILIASLWFTCHAQDTLTNQLQRYKTMYEQGLIDSGEYKALKQKAIGIAPVPAAQVTVVKAEPDSATYSEQARQYKAGVSDATKYFRGGGGVFGGTFICTLFCGPIIGLAPAIACSSTRPSPESLLNKNERLFENPYYKQGYMAQAKRIKVNNAWGAWGVAFGMDAIAGVCAGLIVRSKNLKR